MNLNELDRLAAEKVMRWRPKPNSDGNVYPHCYETTYNDGKTWVDVKSDFHPTRNISQAWECLEKICPVHFRLEQRGTEQRNWFCIVGNGGIRFQIAGETAPIAIVRACLKAKGCEIDAGQNPQS